jgi:hypothetical protein
MSNVRHPGEFLRVNGQPHLMRSVVVFVDVLGTSVLARGTDADEILQSLDRALQRARNRAQVDEQRYWADSSWFSDNLALAAALGDVEEFQEGIFAAVLIAALWIQYLLAIEGFFTRGGLTVGQQFMDERVNFGPALVEAVELEKQANFPRVLVGPAARPLLDRFCGYYARGGDNPFTEHLAVAPDGLLFLNYLGVVYEADNRAEALDMLVRHRRAIMSALDSALEAKARAKVEWLADYHNSFCRAFATDRRDLRIPSRYRGKFVSFEPSSFLNGS